MTQVPVILDFSLVLLLTFPYSSQVEAEKGNELEPSQGFR